MLITMGPKGIKWMPMVKKGGNDEERDCKAPSP